MVTGVCFSSRTIGYDYRIGNCTRGYYCFHIYCCCTNGYFSYQISSCFNNIILCHVSDICNIITMSQPTGGQTGSDDETRLVVLTQSKLEDLLLMNWKVK